MGRGTDAADARTSRVKCDLPLAFNDLICSPKQPRVVDAASGDTDVGRSRNCLRRPGLLEMFVTESTREEATMSIPPPGWKAREEGLGETAFKTLSRRFRLLVVPGMRALRRRSADGTPAAS